MVDLVLCLSLKLLMLRHPQSSDVLQLLLTFHSVSIQMEELTQWIWHASQRSKC